MKFNIWEKVVIVLIGIFLTFTIFMSFLRKTRITDSMDKNAYSFFSMLKNALIEKPFEALFGWVDDVADYNKLRQENESLRKSIDALESYKAKINDQEKTINELQNLLDLKEIYSEYDLISATMISRDFSTWSNYIMIDVGEKDGIEKNMAVILPLGLIGKIDEVYDDYSIVKLLTCEDKTNRVSISIINENETIKGYLDYYDPNENCFVGRLISNDEAIQNDLMVLTSGEGKTFPSGLLVGKVKEVIDLHDSIGKKVLINPAANFNDFTYVAVVKVKEASK